MLKSLFAAAVMTAVTVGASASAAPVARLDVVSNSSALVQSVHWERRGHHRVWVPDYRRHGYHRR